MITFSCHQCGRPFNIGEEFAGRKAKCITCGAPVVIPSPTAKIQVSLEETHPASRSQAAWPPGSSASTAKTNAIDRSRVSQPRVDTSYRGPSPVLPPPAISDTIIPAEVVEETQRPKPAVPMRTRRLIADATQVRRYFQESPYIRVRAIEGDPPDRYVIEYLVRGLCRGPDGGLQYCEQHVVEIQLTRDYPRQSPKCRMLTRIFHPNIDPAVICVGDHWAASERLVDLIVRIGELIAFQAYNIKSPLDGEAAMWADQNQNLLPIDNRCLQPAEEY